MNNRKKIDRTALEIAVIGMAGRFPGAKDIPGFWNNLKNGVESITFFSDRELEEAGVEPSTINNPNYVKAKGVLQDTAYFDASFFDYTPAEAEIMDPQQRLFHECAWAALEDAGYDPGSYENAIGIYAGASPSPQWEGLSLLSGGAGKLGAVAGTALVNKEFLTANVSYKLNLKGPSSFIYTACSTSLVSLHMACKAILYGECQMALAGGVTMIDFVPRGYMYEKDMIMSPDGHNRAFDAKAAGTVSGSGIGVVALKRLKNAISDRDHIYAVIKGTAVNNDGKRKAGFTAPSVDGQAEVIKTAIAMARVDPDSIGYVEAHGTATPIGDPVEIEALKRAFGGNSKKTCGIGSVKTNIGHLDAAAGVAGFIKTVLALKHGLIPPSLHYETANPAIDFENSPFYVVDRPTKWQCSGHPLRAGVSSFGIGGTNAHMILEEAPVPQNAGQWSTNNGCRIIPLSAKSPAALHSMTQNLVDHLKKNPGINLAEMAYTLQMGRQPFPHRRVTVCSNPGDLIETLSEALSGGGAGKTRTALSKGDRRQPVFMFAGVGSQYVNMGAGLYRNEPVFRQEADRCFSILNALGVPGLEELIYPTPAQVSTNKPNDLNHIETAQSVLFILEYSLAKTIMNYGITPHAMIGYSLGEYTAACLSGVFSLEDALMLMVARGKLIAKIPTGTMLSVPMTAEELTPFLKRELAIAIDNGPSCIVAGPDRHLDSLQETLKKNRYLCMRLPNSHAVHSGMMAPILAEFEEHLRRVTYHKPQIPYISNVTGQWITVEDAADPGYWCRHLHQTVRFSEGINRLKELPGPIFIEIGPGRDLSTLLVRHKEEDAEVRVRSVNLIRPAQQTVPDDYYLLSKIGQLWLHGVHINWNAFYRDEEKRRVSLPTYPFDRHRFWVEGNPFTAITAIMTGQAGSTGELKIGFTNSLREETGAPVPGKRSELSTPYAPPATGTQEVLVNIWETYSGFRPVGIDDDFFELGGDSLKFISLRSAIHKKLGVEVPLPEFFNHESIKKLAGFIDSEKKTAYSAIIPAETRDYYHLSSAQKRLFLLQQMSHESVGYNETHLMELEGAVSVERIEDAFREIIGRHEILRTSVEDIGEKPVQRIHRDRDITFTLEYFRLEDFGGPDPITEVIGNFIRPFDLGNPPLMRTALIKLAEYRHLMVIDVHHIASDGWSNMLLVREFAGFYNGDGQLPPLRLQYKDYSEWQQSPRAKDALKQQKTYWLDQFDEEIPVLTLPTDYPRPAVQSFEGARVDFQLGDEETAALTRLVRSKKATLFIGLLAVYNVTLAKLSGQEDIVVGTPVAGRRHADLEQIIGMFVNTLPLRNHPYGGQTFAQFLEQVKKRTLEAFENQEYQFEDLVEQLPVERDVSRNPLFDTMFTLQIAASTGGTAALSSREIKGIKIKPYVFDRKITKFDLTLTAVDNGDKKEGLSFTIEYCSKLFKEETIQRFALYFKRILSSVIENTEKKLAEIQMMPDEEKQQILLDFNETGVDYPKDKTIPQLFQEQVARSRDQSSVISGPLQVTYGELDQRANRLAHMLLEKGVGPDTIVAIKVQRSIEMAIGIFGILKAGGAYLPIATDYPPERTDYILKDSNAAILLTGNEIEEACLETRNPQPATGRVSSTNLAYIIYTSGSTGHPKGVLVDHGSVINTLMAMDEAYPFGKSDVYLVKTAYTFDVSVTELFGWFRGGGRMVLLAVDGEKDPQAIIDTIESEAVTHINFVPSMFRAFIHRLTPQNTRKLSGLKYIFLAGEALPAKLVHEFQQFNTGIDLENIYGPTEASIYASWYSLADWASGTSVPIGKPLPNVTLYILDRNDRLQPIGVPGELCIGGAGLARGYLNRPELTTARFGFLNRSYGSYRTYKTGDLCKWLPDGNIAFLGRRDHQVKIRGFRIEIGEIESRLLMHQDVREALVLAKEDTGGDNYLYAYVVTGIEKEPAAVVLRDYLTAFLPGYMIPQFFIPLETIPLTSSGKPDRRALPAPQPIGGDSGMYPLGNLEEKMAAIWSEILQMDTGKIGPNANFFLLGGHSLRATYLASNIHKEFNVKMPLAEVFKRPTLKKLSDFVRESRKIQYTGIEPAEERDYYALSSAQKRLYFLQQIDLDSTSYNMPLVLPLGEKVDITRFQSTLTKLIARHESMRTSFQMVDGQPVQKIHHHVDFKLEIFQEGARVEDFIRPFDLCRAPLVRSGIIKHTGGDHTWMVDMHHIISDGTSQAILTEDFLALYSGEKPGPLRLHYKDYSIWQNRLHTSGEMKTREDYWLDVFSDAIPRRVDFRTDFQRPEIFTFAGDHYRFSLESEDSAKLRALGSRYGGTLFMNLMAILNTLFYKYSGQTDIIIGCGIAGRPHTDLQGIIGMFVNTLAMRNFPAGEKTYESLLKEVITNSLNAFENQDIQFEELVEKLGIERDPSRNPLFDISLVVQNFTRAGTGTPGDPGKNPEEMLPIRDTDSLVGTYKNLTTKMDLTFFVGETQEGIEFEIEYYTGVFKEETIIRLVSHFKNVLHSVADNPLLELKDIAIITGEEKQRVLYTFNDTAGDYPKDKHIAQLFGEQVKRTPHRVAVICGDNRLTYHQLDRCSNRIAGYLGREKGLTLDDRVGMLLNNGIELVAAILGILKCGAVYVPLDPTLPEERKKHMINDSVIGVVISEKQFIRELNRLQWECRCFKSYLCIDSPDVYSEEETEKSDLMSKELWEHVGETATDEIGGGGWSSSYTGEPFSREEMDEFGDNILKKVKPLLHKEMRVLEIGCASGISMFRIAHHVGMYYGTDLSSVIIEKNKDRAVQEEHKNIKLACLAAHQIDQLEERDFDLVIINSVIQAFHGHNYLRQVIGKCIGLMKEDGHLFLGDIMDLELKEEMIRELVAFKNTHREKNYKTKTDFPEELFLSRGYWEDLAAGMDEIEEVRFSKKIHTIVNELTKFRYDTLLKIDKRHSHGSERAGSGGRHKYQDDLGVLDGIGDHPLDLDIPADSLAYIIYTSGTTGTPKGAAIEHRGLVNFVTWKLRAFAFTPDDVTIQLLSPGFDGFAANFYPGLLSGGQLVMVGRERILDYHYIRRMVRERGVTNTALVPLMYEALLGHSDRESLESIRFIVLAGEKAGAELVNRSRAEYYGITLINEYGPTETTVVATTNFEMDAAKTGVIGKPNANTCVYILDNGGNPQPEGLVGELYIGGAGVARGYINNPGLTADKFVYFNRSDRSYRTYKTGDLGRWLPDGNIEFLGRKDHQVKIRGFRIELHEIENQLLKHKEIKEAVVIVKTSDNKDKYLCAYMVANDDVELAIPDVKGFLGRKLPGYMVPTQIRQIEAIPLTVNGKIDRKALETIGIETGTGLDYVAPRSEIEKKLAGIWQDVLGLEKAGINENFFDLGGTSLDIIRFNAKFKEVFNREESVVQMFRFPTIKSFAQYLSRKISGLDTPIKDNGQPIQMDRIKKIRQNQRRKRMIGGNNK